MDSEKVIRGLEVCLKNIDQQDCPNDCPYLSDCSKYENRVVFQPLMRDAIALLKEQDAVEPLFVENPYTHLPVSYCPKCREPINQYITGNPYRKTKYCHYCGQAVKWND